MSPEESSLLLWHSGPMAATHQRKQPYLHQAKAQGMAQRREGLLVISSNSLAGLGVPHSERLMQEGGALVSLQRPYKPACIGALEMKERS